MDMSVWYLLGAVLVFFMQGGFAMVETGFTRAKNAGNIIMKNLMDFCIGTIVFVGLGYGIMNSENYFFGLIGKPEYQMFTDFANFDWASFFFQLVFCGTAATIVSGAVAERIKYLSFIIFSFVLTLVVYPIVGHWVWGGGWLADLGFMDFAGDTVVHSLGGWSALAGALILGPRIGKYDKQGKPRAIPGHNMSLAVIGLFVLWLGWFGFNPGSTMSFQNPSDVMHILMTTNTSAIAAVVTATATSWIFLGKPDLGMTINGCLAGLVAITGGCSYISIVDSLIIGAIAGVIVVFAVVFFDRAKIDDPVGATSVHLCCGVFGTLCIGLFAQEGVTTLSTRNGLFYGGGASLLGIQLAGILAVGAFTFVSALAVWWILKKTIGIRVSREEELAGLDIGEHGNHAYPDFVQAVENIGYSPDGPAVEPLGEVPVSEAVPVKDTTSPGDQKAPKITKVEIICKEPRLEALKSAMSARGITGMTVSHVLGYGIQKGKPEYYRGAPVEANLLPKIQVDIVVSKVPARAVIETAKKVLYTGHIGDGKIFVYDVENVVKVRTGEEGYAALQDVE